MNFLIYIFLFMILNMVMSFSPMLGMILYFAFIAYFVSSSRKRMRSYGQRSYGQRTYTNTQQQSYANEQQQYSSSSSENTKKVKDAIDVEFTEEEIN